MFRREISKTQAEQKPVPAPVDHNTVEPEPPPTSPLSKFVTSTSLQQETTRLGLLAGEILDLINSSLKNPDSAFQRLKVRDLNSNGLSIRFGQIKGAEDSIFVTDLESLCTVRFVFGGQKGALAYTRSDQGSETLFIEIDSSDNGLKVKPRRIDEKYIIKISETTIGVGNAAAKFDYQMSELKLGQGWMGKLPFFETVSNILYKISSGNYGIKPKPVLESCHSEDLINRINYLNRILSSTQQALVNN